jgi:hypothetical protein
MCANFKVTTQSYLPAAGALSPGGISFVKILSGSMISVRRKVLNWNCNQLRCHLITVVLIVASFIWPIDTSRIGDYKPAEAASGKVKGLRSIKADSH